MVDKTVSMSVQLLDTWMVEQMDEYLVLSMVEMMGWYLADSMAVPLVQH